MYNDIKVNDRIIIRTKYIEKIAKVTSVTNKRFKIDGYVFSKDTGKIIGGNIYDFISVERLTQENEEKFNLKLEKNNLYLKIKNFDFSVLSLEKLKKIKQIIYNGE